MIRNAILSTLLLAFLSSFATAQGPIRSLIQDVKIEHQKQKLDYPGPITYGADDPWTRSKRYHKQTGHYGFFYNCDGEECKRNSPYICWHRQPQVDWRNGWKNALRKDRCDIKQRIADGGCLDCDFGCDSCRICSENSGRGDIEYALAENQFSEQELENMTALEFLRAKNEAEQAQKLAEKTAKNSQRKFGLRNLGASLTFNRKPFQKQKVAQNIEQKQVTQNSQVRGNTFTNRATVSPRVEVPTQRLVINSQQFESQSAAQTADRTNTKQRR